jgi:hypothetical protein
MSPAHERPRTRHPQRWLNPAVLLYPRLRLLRLFHPGRRFTTAANSVEQDTDGNPVHTRRMHDHSYLALVIFGLLETFLGFDWFMGLDWRWASSLFGVYNFRRLRPGQPGGGIVLIALLRAGGYLKMMNHEHFYLMGKLLFGFTIFWAYIAFGQYPPHLVRQHSRGNDLLQRPQSRPLELPHLLPHRGQIRLPVIYLLAQDTKKSLAALTFIAGLDSLHARRRALLVHHALRAPEDHPARAGRISSPSSPSASILGFAYICHRGQASLFPTRDPRLVECLTITN